MKYFNREQHRANNEKHQALGDVDDRTASPSSQRGGSTTTSGGVGGEDNHQDVDYPSNPLPKIRTFSESVTSDTTATPRNVEKDVEAAGTSPGEEDHDQEDAYDDLPRQKAKQRYRRLLLTSNLFFVLGSALYMVMAVEDLKWAKEARSIPEYVLVADDDATWYEFLTQQASQEAEAEADAESPPVDPAWTAAATWIPSSSTDNHQDVQQYEEGQGGQRHRHRQLVLYYHLGWAELPPDAMAAAQTLGYNQELWDNGGYVAQVDVFWNQLSPEQQAAATVLGYTQEAWDSGTESPTFSPTTQSPNASSSGGSTTSQQQHATSQQEVPILPYDDVSWRNLPDNILYAATVLGYNANSWNNDLPPRVVAERNPSWNELNQEEQDAAVILGYSANTWWYIRRNYDHFNVPIDEPIVETEQTDNTNRPPQEAEGEGGGDETAPAASTTATTPDWDLYDWAELPPEAQEAFGVLGYDQTMWDDEMLAETENLGWDELSPAQQEAALFLGYNQAMWDGIETVAPSGGTTSTTTTTIQWEQYGWDELPEEIRLAYSVLGYNKQIWNQGGTTESGNKAWDDLTVTERAAAITLGYTQAVWDGIESTTTGPAPAPALETGSSSTAATGGTTETTTEPSSQPPDAEWYDYAWGNLPVEIQAAYEELGYDEQKWNNGELAYTENLGWDELTSAQQEAAGSLGYTKAIWDGTDTSSVNEAQPEINWDDDYVFLVKSRNVWVSQYQILYFAAALCFVFVGMVDWWRERHLFHLNMILAGLFGVVSAMLMEKDRIASQICNLISVHFYFLEGLLLIREHMNRQRHRNNNNKDDDDDDDESSTPDTSLYSDLWWIPTVQIVADAFFVIGAFMDVILSYFYFEESSEWNLALARVFGFSMLLWVACSVMYLLVTLVLHFGLFSSCNRNKATSDEGQRPPRSVHVDRTPSKPKELRDLNFVAPLPTPSSSTSGL